MKEDIIVSEKILNEFVKLLERKKIINVTNMDLEEWLKLVFSSNDNHLIFIDYMFPTEKMRDEYLESIHQRNDQEVINLLRKFLITSGRMNKDLINLYFLEYSYKNDKKTFDKLMDKEYYIRLFSSISNANIFPWEGNTWIIDLLPHSPKLALDTLNAYYLAHIQLLDERLNGLTDAMSIIRAKFINSTDSKSKLLDINPFQFEHLISTLYSYMGYQTRVTKKSGDGGVDVIAEKSSLGEKEKLLIQCKRKKRKISISTVRELNGVIGDANKGVVITTSDFTRPSKLFASENHRLELINGDNLQILLNKYCGAKWPLHIDYLISESIKKNNM